MRTKRKNIYIKRSIKERDRGESAEYYILDYDEDFVHIFGIARYARN